MTGFRWLAEGRRTAAMSRALSLDLRVQVPATVAGGGGIAAGLARRHPEDAALVAGVAVPVGDRGPAHSGPHGRAPGGTHQPRTGKARTRPSADRRVLPALLPFRAAQGSLTGRTPPPARRDSTGCAPCPSARQAQPCPRHIAGEFAAAFGLGSLELPAVQGSRWRPPSVRPGPRSGPATKFRSFPAPIRDDLRARPLRCAGKPQYRRATRCPEHLVRRGLHHFKRTSPDRR